MLLRTAIFAAISAALCTSASALEIGNGVNHAENSLHSANGRWFVSSQGQLYEFWRNGAKWEKRTLPLATVDGAVPDCYFLGMAETASQVYTVCALDIYNAHGKRYLMRFDSRDNGAPQVKLAAQLSGVAFPNGLAADAQGNLYLADSGPLLLPGNLRKLSMQDGQLTNSQVLHQFPLCKPNGLKIDGKRLYVSLNPVTYLGKSQLLRYELGPFSLQNKLEIASSWSVMDDFALVKGGVLLADFLGGKLRWVMENGAEAGVKPLKQVTSVSVSAAGLLATQRSGQVQWLENDWQLQPR
ncbi:hypothetical protein V8J88_09405 [Massilia sp. W12]|uniref:hypothetical protein n=1 Tax=Massilia sp. W12 TaxID=3126507 RepID=UPI0030D412E7